MSDKSNEFGYIGASPTQARSDNDGVFEVNDVVNLLNDGVWGELPALTVSYLVVAGGEGGS